MGDIKLRTEIKLRYNASAEEVELLVDDTVAATSGADVFKSWVDAYNEAHAMEPVEKVDESPAPDDVKEVDPED